MTQLSRRALLRGSAIAATAAAVSVVPVVASALPEPTGELQALVDQFRVIEHQSLEADEAAEECKYTAAKSYPKRPRALMGKRQYTDGPHLYPLTAQDINEWHDEAQRTFEYEGAMKARQDKLRARQLRRLAWWERREQSILDASGSRLP